MIPMTVLGLTLDAESQAPILVLQQDGGSEIMPIWIGAAEALSISVALNKVEMDRPLTHETMLRAINALGGVVKAVELTDVKGGTYFAQLELAVSDCVSRLDCRPSDGIALAVRCDAPIRVAPEVLEKTAATRAEQRGEDLLTSFIPEQPSEQILAGLLESMEPASRFKM